MCDLPGGATGLLAGQIPDTVAVDNLDVPFPNLTAQLPDLGFPLGYVYIKQIDFTQPIPPGVDIDGTVNGAPGSSIQWRAPTLVAKVKYNIDVFLFIKIHWNDVDTPCTPNDPSQVIVSTLVASPAMTPSLTRTEANVTVGQTIHYQVAVPNTGDVPLTGVSASVPDATCDPPPASIAVATTANVACTHPTTPADVGNDGDATDTFRIKGRDTGSSGYTVTYWAGDTDVTALVRSGTYRVTNLAPGATVNLKVKIRATTGSARGSARSADVTVSSVAAPTVKDIVRARATRT